MPREVQARQVQEREAKQKDVGEDVEDAGRHNDRPSVDAVPVGGLVPGLCDRDAAREAHDQGYQAVQEDDEGDAAQQVPEPRDGEEPHVHEHDGQFDEGYGRIEDRWAFRQ